MATGITRMRIISFAALSNFFIQYLKEKTKSPLKGDLITVNHQRLNTFRRWVKPEVAWAFFLSNENRRIERISATVFPNHLKQIA
jgi:hypothetical protein